MKLNLLYIATSVFLFSNASIAMDNEDSNGSFKCTPKTLMGKITSYLELEDVATLIRCSKGLQTLVDHDYTWRAMAQKYDLGQPENKPLKKFVKEKWQTRPISLGKEEGFIPSNIPGTTFFKVRAETILKAHEEDRQLTKDRKMYRISLDYSSTQYLNIFKHQLDRDINLVSYSFEELSWECAIGNIKFTLTQL